VYWEPETKLLDEKRAELAPYASGGHPLLTSRQKGERSREGSPFYVAHHWPDWHLTRPGSILFPLTEVRVKQDLLTTAGLRDEREAPAREYLDSLQVSAETGNESRWMHSLAIGYSPAYLANNAAALRQDWPRIPLPDSKDALLASAELGRQIAALLDTETDVPGVTSGAIRPDLRVIGAVSRAGGGALNPDAGDLAVTAGWGHGGRGGITMPGKGRIVERDYSVDERDALRTGAEALGQGLEENLAHLGATTRDVYLNDVAYWRNIPAGVWSYAIGGYQVMKKWLSYRERSLLGRDLSKEEAREVMDMARRIAAILSAGARARRQLAGGHGGDLRLARQVRPSQGARAPADAR